VRFAAIGEFDLFDTDAALAQERLHGPLSEEFPEYKLRRARSVHADILILGSSRVMQFRGALFDRCVSTSCVYNAGGAGPTMRVAADFFDEVAAAGPPRVLLIGLDTWYFNGNDEANTHLPTDLTPGGGERVRRSVSFLRQFVPRLSQDPQLRAVVAGLVAAPEGFRGARAILKGEGFRPDGSYSYGAQFLADVADEAPAERSADAVTRVAQSCCRLERFTATDPQALQELERLAGAARRSGTQVIAFTLPFSDELMDAVARDEALRSGFADVDARLTETLQRLGIPFVRLTRPSDAGCRSSEMLDGFHPSEVCSARILELLTATDGISASLASFVDPRVLRARIDARPSDLVLGLP